VAQDEPHVNVGGLLGLGLIWEESLFWVQAYFWEKDLFWEQAHFWRERPIFGAHTIGGRKEACRKRRKNSMHEEKQCGTHADRPNRVRIRVVDKDCNNYNTIK
jgi:hypothetical protein